MTFQRCDNVEKDQADNVVGTQIVHCHNVTVFSGLLGIKTDGFAFQQELV